MEKEKKERKKRRRAKGEGSIFQREDGKWCSKVPVSYNSSGSIKYKYIYGKTQKEVKDKMLDVKVDLKTNMYTDNAGNTLFGVWVANWLDVTKKNDIEESTWIFYEILI